MSLKLGTTDIAGMPDISGKANTSLNNLDATGKNIGNWSSNVTNCITYIPQDIKMELSGGTLTLKAGSKVYVPNGFEPDGTTPKFDEVTIGSDISVSGTSSDTNSRLLYYINGNIVVYISSASGTTTPTSSGNVIFYNTSDNTLKRYNNGSVAESGFSFPLGIITADGTNLFGKIDQVFNGFGYIGSTVFALPGVKGLIPNGRNEDGTLKSEEFTISGVMTRTFTSQTQDYVLGISTAMISITNGYTYNEEENLNYSVSDLWQVFVVGNIGLSSGVVTYLKTNQTFRTLAYSEGVKKSGDTMTGVLELDNADIKLKNTTFDSSTTTAPTSYLNLGTYGIHDSSGRYTGYIQNAFLTSNDVTLQLGARRVISGTNKSSSLSLSVDSSGVASCSFPNTLRCDGGFVKVSTTIVTNVSLNGSTALSYTLSSLPNDGSSYMALIWCSLTTGTTSGNSVYCSLSSDIAEDIDIARAQTRTASSVSAMGAVWLPISSTRKLYVKRETGQNGTCSLYIRGYRRIGLNA